MSNDGFELAGTTTSVRALLKDLVASRELVAMLARKDFFVRFRRASLGVTWAVGLPVIQAAVLAVVFTKVIRIEVGVPYVIFALAGVIPWAYFSASMLAGSTSVVDGSGLASKIYFPRAVLPITVTIGALYTLVPSIGVLLVAMAIGGVSFGPQLLMLVPAVALLVLGTTGLVLVTSALHVYFRDLRFVVQASLTAWFYVTPVIYPLNRVPDSLQAVLSANPMTGVVQLFRAAVLGLDQIDLFPAVWWSAGIAVAFLAMGIKLQARYDRVFVDLL